jgi:hypothetical protein
MLFFIEILLYQLEKVSRRERVVLCQASLTRTGNQDQDEYTYVGFLLLYFVTI